jgi:hypothetical protein
MPCLFALFTFHGHYMSPSYVWSKYLPFLRLTIDSHQKYVIIHRYHFYIISGLFTDPFKQHASRTLIFSSNSSFSARLCHHQWLTVHAHTENVCKGRPSTSYVKQGSLNATTLSWLLRLASVPKISPPQTWSRCRILRVTIRFTVFSQEPWWHHSCRRAQHFRWSP